MTEEVQRLLVVGGGIAGMASAITLRRTGLAVDLIEIDPAWKALGSGITITAPTLRALRDIGLYDAVVQHGAVARGTRMHRYTGEPIGDVPEPAIIDGVPGGGGIMRPLFHRIMADEVRRLGIDVRLGLTVEALTQRAGGVDVVFSDGSRGTYDLVVGADGIHSRVRGMLFPHAEAPRFVGMGGWRVTGERPAGLDKIELYGGAANLAGITPCGEKRAYLWMNAAMPEKVWIAEADQPAMARELFKDFGGNVAIMREAIGPDTHINFRPYEVNMLTRPWHLGRVVLTGDACHATTPQLASGAGMAIEDAIVLAQELGDARQNLDARLSRYAERRFERCRFVVERSEASGEAAKRGDSASAGRIYGEAMMRLFEPI